MSRLIMLFVLLLLLTACGESGAVGPTPTTAVQAPVTGEEQPVETSAAPVATATTAATPTTPVEPGVTFQNPVIRQDFPDPHIIMVDGQYYAYATNTSGRNVQVAVSENLVDWEVLRDAMPVLPRWTVLGGLYVWAPEVMQIGDQFMLYYTARWKEADRQCIGLAVADSPAGPFRDERTEPFICQVDEGGTIDASPFRDGDKLYLYFKNDGNCCGRRVWLYGQELSPDGLALVGEPAPLVATDKVWEGRVVEAPTMFKHADGYYLFFSGNDYGGVQYAVGYATCEGPLGPCEDAPENPILKSLLEKPPVFGPGHQTVIQLGEETWIVYHAWEVTPQGVKTSRRFVWMDRIAWEDGKPVVQGPTTGVQPVPGIE